MVLLLSKSDINSSDIGTGLYGILCKKFHMLLLHNHACHMGSFLDNSKDNSEITMLIYFIITFFITIFFSY
jgi:hypothetical protein